MHQTNGHVLKRLLILLDHLSFPESSHSASVTFSPLRSSSPIQYGSGDEQELKGYVQDIQKKADAFEEAARILRSQIPFKNQI
ncbi:hypothetical protein C0989_011442 [Termitomyces sp. Mn162]|nr:hypothetical protein C0989_011442 [Termitomyces sp. Mn162]